MSFDWRRFFDEQGIHYVLRGRNISYGEIGIKCPFCGSADPSEHMAVSLSGKGWSCRRNRDEHSGASKAKLVAAILGITFGEAARLVGDDAEQKPRTDFEADVARWRNPGSTTPPLPPSPVFPATMKALRDKTGIQSHFTRYLHTRGYSEREAAQVVDLYGLRGALSGAFRYRLIFPVEMPDGLATWTGRAIVANMEPRYKSLSTDPEKAKKEGLPVARRVVSNCLWNAKALSKATGRLLLACEGPFDAMRVDYYGRAYGIRATCLFGKNLSERQASVLATLGDFTVRALLLDTDATMDAARAIFREQHAGLDIRRIPNHVKDPAMLTKTDVAWLLTQR